MNHDNEVSNFYSYLKGIEENIQNLQLEDVDLSELEFVYLLNRQANLIQ